MAKRHGKDGVFKVGANTMKTTKWSLEEQIDVADDTDQGDAAKTHLPGIPSWSGSATAWMNKAETTGQGALTIGASIEGNFYDDGTGTGAKFHSGTCTVTQISRTVDIGSTIEYTFTFQGNGALTHPTV
jgi:hypothetical protein